MIALKHILVATDFEEAADAALAYARALARAFGATLHVLHVTEHVNLAAAGAELYASIDPNLQSEVDDAARKHLEALVIDSDGSGPPTRTVVRRSNAPAPVIVGYAKEHDIDLIVMGTHGRGAIAHLLMGSVAERVVRTASCPVLTSVTVWPARRSQVART